MRTHPTLALEAHDMPAEFFSHVMLWIVGAIAAVGFVGMVGAFWSMGRQSYRD